MAEEIVVSVIIKNSDGYEHVEASLSSLTDLPFPKEQIRVIVVYNGSTEASVNAIKSRFPNVRLICSEANPGYVPGAITEWLNGAKLPDEAELIAELQRMQPSRHDQARSGTEPPRENEEVEPEPAAEDRSIEQQPIPLESASLDALCQELLAFAAVRSKGGGPYRNQLANVLKRVNNSRGAVVFLPSVGWNLHLFQRPHYLARHFARSGYISIFDSSNSSDDVKGFQEIESNLFLFKGPTDLLHEIPDSVLWAFPYNFEQKDAYPETVRTVYDWINDLDIFPYDRDFLERSHQRALEEATWVVSVSHRLHERAVAVRSDAIYLPNGVEYERFATDETTVPEDVVAFVGEGKPIAGYYGALSDWFDYKLLDEVAGLRSDWNFMLIGPMLDESIKLQPVLNRRNVKWIGPRQYTSLPGYSRAFDVAITPFVINNITQAISPPMLYEHFAAGKAVITTPIPECESFSEVRIVRSAEEFSKALDGASEQGRDETYKARVRALARANSWTIRAQTVERLLDCKDRPNDRATKSHAPVISRSTDQSDRANRQLQELGAAADLARRFDHLRTIDNQRFFNALCKHLASLRSNPVLPICFEFAMTCNAGLRRITRFWRKHTRHRGKHYLDLGFANRRITPEALDELSKTLIAFAGQETNRDKIAELLSNILPIYLEEPRAAAYFEFWQSKGFHITPVHYYQPLPDTRELPDEMWDTRSEMAGIDANEHIQLDLLRNAFPHFRDECNQIPNEPTKRKYDFHFNNGAIDGMDALVLYCMVRHFKPNLVLEVGSGFSSRLTAQAALLNGNTKLVCIEPYPDALLRRGFPGLHTLLPIRVQEAGFSLFGHLGENDILFIDSSHVVKCGGDVNYLFLEVLPRLNPGVIVHIHDIFLPNEFPRNLVKEQHLFWTEQYLLQAFLTFNSEFEVLFANEYMAQKHYDELKATFPKSQWWGGGSFWIRRKPASG